MTDKEEDIDVVGQGEDGAMDGTNMRQNLMHISHTLSAAIQTLHRARRTAATQTDQAEGENQAQRPQQ